MGIFSDVVYYNYNLGVEVGGRSAGILQMSDLGSTAVAPFYLDGVKLDSAPVLLKFFGKAANSKAFAGSTGAGQRVVRWFENDGFPITYRITAAVATAAAGGTSAIYVSENAGLEPKILLKNLRTGEVVCMIDWYTPSSAMTTTPPTKTQLATPGTYGLYVLRNFGNTTSAPMLAGDELVRLNTGAEEGGYSSIGANLFEAARVLTLTDHRQAWEVTEHAKQVKMQNGALSVSDRRAQEINKNLRSIENMLWFGEASSTTAGTGEAVAAIYAGEHYQNTTATFVTGEGIQSQVEQGGNVFDFGGGFSFNTFNEIINETTRKNGANRISLFHGSYVGNAINRYAAGTYKVADKDDPITSIIGAQVKQIICDNGCVVDLIPVPAFDEAMESRRWAFALNLDYIIPVHMNGMPSDPSVFVENIQHPEKWSQKDEVRFVGGIAVGNLKSHSLLIGIE